MLNVNPKPTIPAILGHIPVFPLPETVLFPGVILPLHIFEPRYREMIVDAMASHCCVVIAMIEPGTEGLANPPVCEVACLGRVIHVEDLKNERYNVLVQGIERVRLLEEVTSHRKYRTFHAEQVPRPTTQALARARLELARLQSCVYTLSAAAAECDQELVEVLRSTADPIELTDILAAVLVREPTQQQDLLATVDFRVRLAQVVDTLAEVILRYGDTSAAKSN